MIDLASLQKAAPHKNHSSVVRSVFEYIVQGQLLTTVYPAYGAVPPELGATVSRSPRVVICLSGENRMVIPQGTEAAIIVLKPFEATFICGNAWNRPTHDVPHSFLTLDFSFDHLRYFIKDQRGNTVMQNPQTHVRRDGGQDRFTSYTLHAAESLIDEHETSRPESLLQLVRSLVHQAYDRLSDEPELERITPVAKWEIVKEFIDAHLHEPLTRDDVAAAIDVHPNHLSRFVKMFSGTSYATHLRQKRMKRATELLCAYDIPIYEVAKRCGYPSPANFSNAFRQSFQCSPGTYRKDAAPPA